MIKSSFAHVDTWVFDLDNTLYHPSVRLFDQIEARMTAYVMRELNVDREKADNLRKEYWRDHGTTLAGLMRVHGLDPIPYLDDVHDIDFSGLSNDPQLLSTLSSLPGRKLVYTNGSAPYARNVLRARGIESVMDDVFGIEHAAFNPKPDQAAFDAIFALAGVDPKTAAMFEDDPRNLRVPHADGMQTIHVADDPAPAAHIHHHTADLTAFLSQLV